MEVETRDCDASDELAPPSRTVYSNVDGKPHSSDPEKIKEAMCAQLMAGEIGRTILALGGSRCSRGPRAAPRTRARRRARAAESAS